MNYIRYNFNLIIINLVLVTIIVFPGCISRQLNILREDISQIQQELKKIQKENQELNQKLINLEISLDNLEKGMQEGKISLEDAKKKLAKIRERFGLRVSNVPTREATKQDIRKPSTTEDYYRIAYVNYRLKKYEQAATEFKSFIKRFPESELIDVAQFWLGECYYAQGNWSKAIEEYLQLIKLYPFGSKVPDAYLKLGFCYIKQANKSKALENFQILIDIFPHSQAASIAKERIRSLK